MFIFISFIAWLANKEIDESLNRARYSEKQLEIERNSLEQKISERTEELINSQLKTLSDANQSIHIGELARGVIHDLLSPLSAINLYVEELSTAKIDMQTRKILINKAISTSNRMKEFMESVRRYIGPSNIQKHCKTDLNKEISIIQDIFSYKLRSNNIQIKIDVEENTYISCLPQKIHQIFLNLLSNSIDACSQINKDDNQIIVMCKKINTGINITVSDNGCGIPEKQLETIFTKPNTTKVNGNGIGLRTINNIVTKELQGTIKIHSKEKTGTSVDIYLPTINSKIKL